MEKDIKEHHDSAKIRKKVSMREQHGKPFPLLLIVIANVLPFNFEQLSGDDDVMVVSDDDDDDDSFTNESNLAWITTGFLFMAGWQQLLSSVFIFPSSTKDSRPKLKTIFSNTTLHFHGIVSCDLLCDCNATQPFYLPKKASKMVINDNPFASWPFPPLRRHRQSLPQNSSITLLYFGITQFLE
uniref:Transmembrane protein n=1 Tax=Glossina pallidipes TaxID=7398 RepID=A0A1B0AJH6_GLOPL